MLTWGGGGSAALFVSVPQEELLALLLRAGTPVDTAIVSRAFNWLASCPSQLEFTEGRATLTTSAWASPRSATVQVGEVGRLLLALLPHCAVDLQLALLGRLGRLLEASILNRSRCSELRLLRTMLELLGTPLADTVQKALLGALTPLASHSVSVSELKLLFSLLASQPTEGSGLLHAELLATISSMLRQAGPSACFLFDGGRSGLVLPPLPKLSPNGYTFYAWVRVDSFAPPDELCGNAGDWAPRLLSLHDEQGRGPSPRANHMNP